VCGNAVRNLGTDGINESFITHVRRKIGLPKKRGIESVSGLLSRVGISTRHARTPFAALTYSLVLPCIAIQLQLPTARFIAEPVSDLF